jgi:hypothetical protein
MQKENSMGFNWCKGPLRFSTPCWAGGAQASIRQYPASQMGRAKRDECAAEILKPKSPLHIDLRDSPS